MYSKIWLILKDDYQKTFEVFEQSSNDSQLCNHVNSMQRIGMEVSFISPPVTNKQSIKIIGYTYEVGLNERLLKQFNGIMINHVVD